MDYRVITQEKLSLFLNALRQSFRLAAPVEEEGEVYFRLLEEPSQVYLGPKPSRIPLKVFFFPPTEPLLRYRREGESWEVSSVEQDSRPLILFGLRPCDLQSLKALDAVFLGSLPDPYYAARRENTLLLGMSCPEVGPGCFCVTYGYSPTTGEGADLHFTLLGKFYLVEVLTPKGKKLVEDYASFFAEETAGALEAKQSKEASLLAKFVTPPQLTGVKEKLPSLYHDPYWEELAWRCLGCGICTFLCPTCHCFDIFDRGEEEGERLRCWDTCLFKEFTLHTSGHNPRASLSARLRNRFYHKLLYHYERYGVEGCVGCGRCVTLCPVNIDIREVMAEVRRRGSSGT
ncbi:4Fe-4S ferredoxin iron-sulfur binding domain protein [Ammonifex degensii KC4]|uniref:4Fe-4S ferredoxin iron-sulfur binding domain protein n=1 Tax=Ammonifex degensii (strain DSM 10501 / KC4) TaxID=429009 RepID=C9R808_AMMDK|nr:4Fe-4S dicluster domain-containing protein [Ammonifex degensii]ACX52437.1 4Fe-4S ferredoxin iron-sulfur binding domain protein [Ammonifex degensii KC4]